MCSPIIAILDLKEKCSLFYILTELFNYILVLSYVTLLESLLIRVLLIGGITKLRGSLFGYLFMFTHFLISNGILEADLD